MKDTIYYHRAYRKQPFSKKNVFWESIALLSPILLVLFLYPVVTLDISKFSTFILSEYFIKGKIEILKRHYVFSRLYIVSMHALFHSPLFYLVFFLFSFFALIIMLLFIKTQIFRPIFLYSIYILSINAVSSAFFVLAPFRFPYDLATFSDLYIKTEVAIWFFIPVILAMALIPLPSNFFIKFLVSIAALIYSVIFAAIRYILFLYLLEKFSFVFMATLFFAFGPLIDFIYIVGIYSYYLSIVSKKNENSIGKGQWLY
ncbi:MAG: hypothetical protein ACYCTB_07250 [bacterium]